jgi:hypothetical protein
MIYSQNAISTENRAKIAQWRIRANARINWRIDQVLKAIAEQACDKADEKMWAEDKDVVQVVGEKRGRLLKDAANDEKKKTKTGKGDDQDGGVAGRKGAKDGAESAVKQGARRGTGRGGSGTSKAVKGGAIGKKAVKNGGTGAAKGGGGKKMATGNINVKSANKVGDVEKGSGGRALRTSVVTPTKNVPRAAGSTTTGQALHDDGYSAARDVCFGVGAHGGIRELKAYVRGAEKLLQVYCVRPDTDAMRQFIEGVKHFLADQEQMMKDADTTPNVSNFVSID